jgi:RNA polymerase sigma-70 factor (ECF subfamily)
MTEHLSDLARSRDRAAFENLFRHFAPRVKAYIMKLGGDAAVAEELMQETMVLVWRKAGQFDPAKSSASTWIFTIARNLRIDAFRRERRPELDPDDPALAPEPDPSADAAVILQQSAERLNAAIIELGPNEQVVLQLAFFEDKSHSVISDELGIPLGTVKSRLRLAFGKLRSALEESVGGRT